MSTQHKTTDHFRTMSELFDRARYASADGSRERLQSMHLLLDAIRIGREGCDANLVLRELHSLLPDMLGITCQATSCAPELILGTIDLIVEEMIEAALEAAPDPEKEGFQLSTEQLRVLRRLTPNLHFRDS